MTDTNRDRRPIIPTDTDELPPDRSDQKRAGSNTTDDATRENSEPNPPHTTSGNFTAPKFGSAGSGGLEYESELEKD
ncbi:MAG TPA: hypothetical protein VLJ83_10445 [Gemmatimonadaceae bacterium]|nr:hypothetical protein [Gemmatimonadaceae bacterium]